MLIVQRFGVRIFGAFLPLPPFFFAIAGVLRRAACLYVWHTVQMRTAAASSSRRGSGVLGAHALPAVAGTGARAHTAATEQTASSDMMEAELFFRPAVPRPLRGRRRGLNMPLDRVFHREPEHNWAASRRAPPQSGSLAHGGSASIACRTACNDGGQACSDAAHPCALSPTSDERV